MTKVYYAHSQEHYRTQIEKEDLEWIRKTFPAAEIFNPATEFRGNRDWKIAMKRNLMKQFDVVIVREIDGMVGRGVFDEIKQAQRWGKRIGVLRDGACWTVKGVISVARNNWKRYGRVVAYPFVFEKPLTVEEVLDDDTVLVEL